MRGAGAADAHLSLRDEEVREDETPNASGSPEEEHLDAETCGRDAVRLPLGGLVDEVRCRVARRK